jgi:hypothetical protein
MGASMMADEEWKRGEEGVVIYVVQRWSITHHTPRSELGRLWGEGRRHVVIGGLASAELGYPWDDLNWRLEV